MRVGFTEADWAAIPPANRTFSFLGRQRLMHHADPATAIHYRLAPEPGDIVVRKTRYGALSTTDLDRRLQDRGITTLVIAGVTTSGVVLSTVTDAADRDYRLHVLSDGVADPDPQAHQALMTGVFPRLAHIVDTAELRALLHQGHHDRAETGGA
ncbi:cysteine hydrolase [Microbispora sp. NPDC088329]|uniref:cysteine hydrolase n=1 Tax=Microbispora sp. NPDC088329 TaxID=3154869 RepID=UPI0034449BD5